MRVIAIDGPAASGKSSTALGVARALGWGHLDSGALYRAVTLAALDRWGDGGDEGAGGPGEQGPKARSAAGAAAWSPAGIVGLLEALPVRLVLVDDVFRPEVAGVDVDQPIRSDRVTRRVSQIAAIPEVRHWVNVQQRDAVGSHPRGVVVDGRDIGTVVFPDAPLKVFLTATPEERARRRLAQRGGRIDPAELTREAAALGARDRADATRRVAPLRPAADAVLLDTTRLSFDEQVARVVALARKRLLG